MLLESVGVQNIYTYALTVKKAYPDHMTLRNVTVSFGTSCYVPPALQREYPSQPETEKSRVMSFWLSGAYFTSSPRGNVEHFLIIQVCEREALWMHCIHPLMAAAYLQKHFFFNGSIYPVITVSIKVIC